MTRHADLIAKQNLESIANGAPDSKLGPFLSAAVPELKRRGWLRVRGCSDGNYVEITAAGKAALEARAAEESDT